MTGNTTWISSKVHQHIIKKFNQCWIPDVETKPNLSGKLGHLENPEENIKYIGPLSRLHRKPTDKKYDLMVILSGPEPQRGMLEAQLTQEMGQFKGKVVFIKGKIESEQKIEQAGNVTYYNFMNTEELENTFNESEIVLCRSGYTTIMDLAQLGKSFFYPNSRTIRTGISSQKTKEGRIGSFCQTRRFQD